MSNLRLKEVAKEATNKDFYNSFFTSSKVTTLIGYFGQLISALTEFHFIFSAAGGAYQPPFTLSNILAFLAGSVAVYIFEVVGVRIYLVRIIRQIVNLDFSGSERKMLFGFNLIFVVALCGANLVTSFLGQKYSFASKTNVTTTDKTHQLSNDKNNKVEAINSHFNDLQTTLISNYDNDKTSIQSNFDDDVKALKNSQSKFKDLDWKYNEYTLKIDKKGEEKTAALNALLSQLNIDKEQIRSDRTTQINSVTGTYDNRINDVSKVAISNVGMWLLVQKYTLPILIIFILLSWVAIVYNEVFLKGSGQTIEIKAVAKKPLLITVFLLGIYEKIYQFFYWIVGTLIGNKKYQFDDIQQYVVKYELNQNKDTETRLKIESQNGWQGSQQVRQIGYNRNNQNNTEQPKNEQPTNNFSGLKMDDLSNDKTMNYTNNDNSITKVVTIPKSDLKGNERSCKNCNEKYIYKHHKQMYCKNACRIENWEKRTGKTLKKKSKK
jgi:hypothetical protein